MPVRHYTGIGSRETPEPVLRFMERIATVLAAKGFVLRSGHAEGADQAFERGAAGNAEIYLPMRYFQGAIPKQGKVYPYPTVEAFAMASRFHPNWGVLGNFAQACHARNMHQVMGHTLAQPAKFVICWTPDGAVKRTTKLTGGTGQAIRCAVHNDIEVFNLARPEHVERIETGLLATTAA